MFRRIVSYFFPKREETTCFLCEAVIDKNVDEFSTLQYVYSGGRGEKFLCSNCASPVEDNSFDLE